MDLSVRQAVVRFVKYPKTSVQWTLVLLRLKMNTYNIVYNVPKHARTKLHEKPLDGDLDKILTWLAGLNIRTLNSFSMFAVTNMGVITHPTDCFSIIKSNVSLQFAAEINPQNNLDMAGMIIADRWSKPILFQYCTREILKAGQPHTCRYDLYFRHPDTLISDTDEYGQYYHKGKFASFRRKWDGSDRSGLLNARVS